MRDDLSRATPRRRRRRPAPEAGERARGGAHLTIFQVFILISLFYVLVGIRNLFHVVSRWSALWDDDVTGDDLRLARSASFYLLIPPTVALHELGHAALIWAQGLRVDHWMFLGYMGAVWPSGSAGALGDFAIALAGNVVTLLIGAGALAWGVARPGHAVRNVLWIEVGRQSLFLVLVFYPLICIVFPGDFQLIYDFERTPIAAGITAAVHALLLALGYGVVWKQRWRPRAVLLSSPLAAKLVAMEERLANDPGDLNAVRELGLLHSTAGDHARARKELERAVEGGRADPRVRIALGSILAGAGEAAAAVPHLEQALNGLLRAEERLLAQVPLARALITLGRIEEARAVIGEARAKFPANAELRELADRLVSHKE